MKINFKLKSSLFLMLYKFALVFNRNLFKNRARMRHVLVSFLILVVLSCKEKEATTTLYHLVRQPETAGNKTPLLILLHGIGSNEKDLFSLAGQLPADFMVVAARAPFETGRDSYAWYEADFSAATPVYNKIQAEKSRMLILQFIEQLKETYQFDEQQVYLCGFSQGGIMAYSVGLTRPEKIKGMAIMSGKLPEDIKPLIQPGPALKKLAVFIAHGRHDNIIGIQDAKTAHAHLKEWGMAPVYKEYAEAHTISHAMLADLVDWLRKK